MRRLMLLLLIVCAPAQAQTPPASDPDPVTATRPDLPPRSISQEQALQRQIPMDEHRQLGEGESTFLGLFLPAARPDPLGSVLLIADVGEHANWPELIEPARVRLSETGWNTLAIGLPDAPAATIGTGDEHSTARQARFEEQVAERLNLGLALLNEAGATPVAVIARGQAGVWIMHLGEQLSSVDALITHQPRSTNTGTRLEPLLEQWDKPLLDIATKGALGRSESARQRQLIAQRNGHQQYRQILVSNPGNAAQTQQMLIKRIDGWLRQLPAAQRNPR